MSGERGFGPIIIQHVAAVGWYEVGGPTSLRIELTKRPHWLGRIMCRVLLDWHWRDAPEGHHAIDVWLRAAAQQDTEP